ESEPADLVAVPLPLGEAGAACDPRRLVNGCVAGTACLPDADENPICTQLFAPVLADGQGFVNLDVNSLGVRVRGTDADQDVQSLSVSIVNGDGEVILTYAPLQPGVLNYGDNGMFTAEFSGVPPDDISTVDVLRVTVTDAFGQTSNAIDLAPQAPTPNLPNARCDPALAFNLCPEGTACFDNEGDEIFNCVPVQPPVIDSADGYINDEPNAIGLRIEGSDPDGDVIGFQLELLDADGNVILPVDPADPVWLQFTRFVPSGAIGFVGSFSFPLPDLLGFFEADPARAADVAVIRVAALDQALLLSEIVEIVPDLPPVVRANALCDPFAGLNRCEGELRCLDIDPNDENPARCIEVQAACPDGWVAGSINESPAGDGWRVEGDNSLYDDHTAGSCGGDGSQDAVYEFTAPEDGPYAFTVSDTFATALYVRSLCAVPDEELACVAPLEAATVVVELAAGETVYAFVDNWLGIAEPFTLTVAPFAAPQLLEAAAWFNPEAQRMSIEAVAVPGSSELDSFGAQFLDVNGDLVLLEGDPGPFAVGGLFEAVGDGTFTGFTDFTLPDIPEFVDAIAAVRVTVLDLSGGSSEAIDVVPDGPSEVAFGETCDPFGTRSYCLEGDCLDLNPADEVDAICQIAAAECPAEWTVLGVGEPDANGVYTIPGDLTVDLEDHGATPTCSGAATGANDIYGFTAPSGGMWRFATVGAAGNDTILFVRRLCGVQGEAGELACNDDGPNSQGFYSDVDVELAEGDTVYVFVDSYFEDGRGAYSLVITPLP
ncbi:MAG: hypothetical protein KC620_15010, partial [Myxococcales bacterium]|nr:hypothetical protein [Myxococcales bacterium]